VTRGADPDFDEWMQRCYVERNTHEKSAKQTFDLISALQAGTRRKLVDVIFNCPTGGGRTCTLVSVYRLPLAGRGNRWFAISNTARGRQHFGFINWTVRDDWRVPQTSYWFGCRHGDGVIHAEYLMEAVVGHMIWKADHKERTYNSGRGSGPAEAMQRGYKRGRFNPFNTDDHVCQWRPTSVSAVR